MNKNISKEWYIFYLFPRSEKKVHIDLVNRDYETFLPLKKEMKPWRNRQKKLIETPLFPGYIFVHTLKDEIYKIVRLPKVVNFIHTQGLPSTIRSEEIETIKQMIDSGKNIAVENQCTVGCRVKIIFGPLAGHTGVLIQEKGKCRFGIKLDSISQTASIEISEEDVIQLDN